jgi:hypothetical protein
VSQQVYVEKITESLIHEAIKPDLFKEEELGRGELLGPEGIRQVQSITGSIGYAAYKTRPDVAAANAKVQEFQSKARTGTLRAAENLLKSMVNRSDLAQTFVIPLDKSKATSVPSRFLDDWEVIVKVDASFGVHKARQGLVVQLRIGKNIYTVYSKTSRQKVFSLSTAEAELIGLTWAAKTGLGIRNVIQDLFGDPAKKHNVKPVRLINDNTAAVTLARGAADIRKVRHLTLGYLFVQQCTSNGSCIVEQMLGDELCADALTKVLTPAKTDKFLLELGLQQKGQSEQILVN